MLNLKFRLQDDDDPFIKGEFDVIKELLEKVSCDKTGKNPRFFHYLTEKTRLHLARR